jgi:hypothetical protein
MINNATSLVTNIDSSIVSATNFTGKKDLDLVSRREAIFEKKLLLSRPFTITKSTNRI